MAKQYTKQADESMEALKTLRSEAPLAKVYLLYGEDACVMDQIIDAISDKRFKGGPVDSLSWEVYRAGDIETQKVLDSLRTISIFGGIKVVVYRDVEKVSEADLQKIADYASSPVRAHLVLAASKIDIRRKSWKLIKEKSCAVSCAPLTDRNMGEYVVSAAKGRNLKLSNGCADALANFIGPNRGLIDRALEKLSLAVPNGTVITPEIVEYNVVDTRERSVFELTRAITERNIPMALASLRTLIDQRQEPIVINGMLARHARMLLQVKLGQSQRLTNDEISQRAGINPYAMREYLSAMPRYSLAELYRFHADVYDADRALKSRPVPPELVLSRLLMGLMKPVSP